MSFPEMVSDSLCRNYLVVQTVCCSRLISDDLGGEDAGCGGPGLVWFTFTYIYIYAFSRHFYPKRLTVHSGYTFFVSICVPWELNPQPFALRMQCSTTEPQKHWLHMVCGCEAGWMYCQIL